MWVSIVVCGSVSVIVGRIKDFSVVSGMVQLGKFLVGSYCRFIVNSRISSMVNQKFGSDMLICVLVMIVVLVVWLWWVVVNMLIGKVSIMVSSSVSSVSGSDIVRWFVIMFLIGV